MQINSIQNNNTTFGAKVNVIGGKLPQNLMSEVSDKAKKIGLENDVVELKFSPLISMLDRHSYVDTQKYHLVNHMFDEFRQKFEARFIPGGNGKGLETVWNKLLGSSRSDMEDKQKQVVNDYLDKLIETYGN